MSELEQRALRIWASTTSAPLAQGIIVEFAHRLMAEQGEPVGIVRDLFTGRVQWLVELPHGTKLYASPPSYAQDARRLPEKMKLPCTCYMTGADGHHTGGCECGNYDDAHYQGYAQGWNDAIEAMEKSHE